MKTVAVVLAAGESKRLGQPKQLLSYRGEPLVRHAARVALGAGCDETIVVAQPGALREALRDLPVTIVDNADFEEGMASSIRAASRENARLLIALCDQPLVTSEHLRALLAIEAPIVATQYQGIKAVPAVFAPELLDELRALTGDRGARAVIDAHANVTQSIVFEPAAVDIDTVPDLESLGG